MAGLVGSHWRASFVNNALLLKGCERSLTHSLVGGGGGGEPCPAKFSLAARSLTQSSGAAMPL